MCGFERLGNLLRNWQGFIKRERSFGDPVGEGWPLHQLQHQRTGTVGFFKAVNGRDVRVVQAGKNLRLSLEPGQPVRISRKRLRQDLQRHLAVELGIGGLIDLSHTPLADEGGDIVMAESGADSQGHGYCGMVCGSFYAQAVNGSTGLHTMAPTMRAHAFCGRSGPGQVLRRLGGLTGGRMRIYAFR